MKTFLDKFFFRSRNLDQINQRFNFFFKGHEVKKIFEAIRSYSENSEVRFVGGCVRKIINNESVNDVDLATNLSPVEVCDAFKKMRIYYFESGIDHGTITALINKKKFEITSLRKDIVTDGRHAKVEFTKNWKEDASRRDFTINSIYADHEGNLFDPFNGRSDLKNGRIVFIGNAEDRIKEDYLRILRYIRFFLDYSKHKHDTKILGIIRKNLNGVMKISPDRLLNEFEKITVSKNFLRLINDKSSLGIISLLFPQFKNIGIFSKLNDFAKNNFYKMDFIFLISLMVIDGSDNIDYFIYKFNISNKDQKRLKFLDNFYKKKITSKTFIHENLNQIFYFNGKQSLIDLINFKIFKSKKIDTKLTKMVSEYEGKEVPIMPFGANILMKNYGIAEGKELGKKLKMIEEAWAKNNFQISSKEVEIIIKD